MDLTPEWAFDERDRAAMAVALAEAAAAGEAGDVPVGAVLLMPVDGSWRGPATGGSATATLPPTPSCWPCGPGHVRWGAGAWRAAPST